jgi:linoleoyl-CoA desaturase
MKTRIRNESYEELARVLRQGGWYRPATGRILLELVVHLTMMLGGLCFALEASNPVFRAVAYIVSAMGGLGITTNTHTSSHYATTGNRRLNQLLTYFGYTFFFGTSASYWWHKHCVVHHPRPNLIGIDEDADLMPWFAINEDDFERSRGLRRLLFRVQWVIIPLAIGLNVFNTQRQGWQHLLRILADPAKRKSSHWFDLGVLLSHWVALVLLPMIFYGPAKVLAVYSVEMILIGYAMFIAFAPAHFPEEAIFASHSQKDEDFVLRQTVTTVNFRTGWLGRLLCSGVEYQIEHHLFPAIPHIYYPKLSGIVQRYCIENGYPYRTLGWGEAVWKALLIFRSPKKVAAELRWFGGPDACEPAEASELTAVGAE